MRLSPLLQAALFAGTNEYKKIEVSVDFDFIIHTTSRIDAIIRRLVSKHGLKADTYLAEYIYQIIEVK